MRAHSISVAQRPSSLGALVMTVVGIGAKEEMIGTNAKGVVALMKDIQSIGYLAKVKEPGEPMRLDALRADT